MAGSAQASQTHSAMSAEPTSPAAVDLRVWDQLQAEGSTDFWVYLREEADLAPAREITDRAAQGEFVYQRLTRTAKNSQADLTELLEAAGAAYQRFWITNAVKVTGDADLVRRVAALPEVGRITADRTYRLPQPAPADAEPTVQGVEWNIDRINAPQVWDTFGATGEGIVVGVIDSGAQFDHPALVRQYRGNKGDGEFDHNYNWYDPSAVCTSPALTPCDNVGHGTHVTGTIVGDDGGANKIGVAPGARWIAAKGCETRN
ncbi:MAG: S8 family serine peptidase, partial [Chloroflexota bacterium]